jgi:hypothetical protein
MFSVIQIGLVQYHTGAVVVGDPPFTGNRLRLLAWIMTKYRIMIRGIALYGRRWYAARILSFIVRLFRSASGT